MLGPEAVVDTDASGMPRVAPRSADGVALVLQAAAAEGWRVRIEGRGSWVPADAPADLALTTRLLARVVQLDAADLVASVEAGVLWGDFQQQLAEHGVWVAADPPGEGRTVGSVVATGTAGPLRTGFGALRDQVLGATVVTGQGRIVHAGGRVVKNVAGYDLTKLATGSFGSLGVVTSVNLRLRAVPRRPVCRFDCRSVAWSNNRNREAMLRSPGPALAGTRRAVSPEATHKTSSPGLIR